MYPGAMREHRRILREEAEARQARVLPERTARYRREHGSVEEIMEIVLEEDADLISYLADR
jgi:nucleotide-binding universal stress UspA family protein